MNSAAASPADEQPLGLLQAFERWMGEFRPLLAAVSDLAISEARLAAVSLASMFAIAVAVAILGAAAWIGFTAAIALWLFDGSVIWLKTAATVCVLSTSGVGVGYLIMRHLSIHLDFHATRDLLAADRPADSGRPSDDTGRWKDR